MKSKIIFLSCLFLAILMNLSSQNYLKFDTIQFKSKADYIKNESHVLECVNFFLNSPIHDNANNINNLKAIQFVMRWMEGTPDFSFNLDESITKATKSNSSLLGVFLASMVKYSLENKDKSKEVNEVKYNSFIIFLDYCIDPNKNVKLDKELKALIKAKNNNSLKEYLKI